MPRQPEHALHRQLADLLTLEIAPAGKLSPAGVVWWSVDHASYAGAAPGARICRGIVAGQSDVLLLHVGKACFLEVKARGGVVSDPQRTLATAVLAAGGRVGVVDSAEQTLACLDAWNIPRNHRIRCMEAERCEN